MTTSLPVFTIGVDGNEANVINRVGSNVYAFEILRQFEKITRGKDSVSWIIYLSSPPEEDMPKEREGWKYKIVRPATLSTQWSLPLQLYVDQNILDVFFTPGHYAPRFCPVPYISCVMDLAYLKFPTQFRLKDLYQLRHWTAYSIRKASHIITISEATKLDIIEKYKISEKNITVAYPALRTTPEVSDAEQKNILKKFNIKKPYFLYVGTLQPRKNLVRLIKAYELFASKKGDSKKRNTPNVDLVIAGKIGWLADDIVKASKKSLFADNIHLTGYVSEQEKAVLYKNSSAVVLVGLYEGFGMPPLEALMYGKIPVVSNTSSLPEVVDKAGILVDPYSIESISLGLQQAYALSKEKNSKWLALAQRQVRKFSWEKSAEKILKKLLTIEPIDDDE